jgi:hypothetical protein
MNGGLVSHAFQPLTVSAGTATLNGVDVSTDQFGVAIALQGGTMNVRNSRIRSESASNTETGIQVLDFAGSRTLNLTGSTVVARGPAPTALEVSASTGRNSTVHVVNSALRAIPTGGTSPPDVTANRGGSGQLVFTASHSYYGKVAATGVTVPAPGSGTNVGGDPGFADPAAGDYRLLPSSALIDRGDPAATHAGERDFAGAPRSRDGNGDCIVAPDIGAFERPPLACPDKIPPKITRVRFKPRKLRVGRRGRLSLRLSERAKLTVAVQRRKHGKWRAFAKLVKPFAGPGAVKIRIGPKVKRKRLRRGRYRIRLRAADTSGNRSLVRSTTFRVVRR